MVANYPYDDSDGPTGQASLTEDNDIFVELARYTKVPLVRYVFAVRPCIY